VHHLERHGHHGPGIVLQPRLGHENQELPVPQPIRDLRGGLLARELTEKFLDVLDFKRAGIEWVLLDQVFQGVSAPRSISNSLLLFHERGQVRRPHVRMRGWA
jgi:hypothetical protein